MILAIIVSIVIIVGIILSTIALAKESKRDWNTVEELEEKANNVKTKEEIVALHKEFVEKSSRIHNKYCRPHLSRIDGYLRGLYKSMNENGK